MGESGATHYKAQRRRPDRGCAAPQPDRADDSAPRRAKRPHRRGSDGQRLDNFLAKILKGVPRTHLYRVIRSGEVRVNKGRAAADTRLALGDEVRIPPMRVADRSERPEAPGREFAVVHEDEAIVCIDKPAGVAVHGGSGESFGVIEQMRRARPGEFLELVHRLDKETSGLLLVAKTRPALVALQNDLRSRAPGRAIGKTYAALVVGAWPESLKVIDVALRKDTLADGSRHVSAVDEDDERGRRSISLVRVAQRFADFSLLDVTLEDRPHAPDPGPSRRRRPCDRRRSEVRRLRAQPSARARPAGRVAALRPDVPARAAPALRASGERRADRARSTAAGGVRSACSRRSSRVDRERLAPTSPPGVVRLRWPGERDSNADVSSPARPELGCSHGDATLCKGIHIMKTKLLAIASAAALGVGAHHRLLDDHRPRRARSDPIAKRHGIDANVDGALSRLYAQDPSSREMISKARGVLVFPSIVAAGFVVGGSYGQGALRVRGRTERVLQHRRRLGRPARRRRIEVRLPAVHDDEALASSGPARAGRSAPTPR